MYTWQIYKLSPNKYTSNLTEENPRIPFHQEAIAVENFTHFPTYTPPEAGMYSVILEVGDAANNTRYCRRLVLYDNVSSVSTNEDHRLFVGSAAPETSYRWQSSLHKDVVVNWTGHFENRLHAEKKLLNPVDTFKRLDFGNNMIKKVDNIFEDFEGRRSLKPIPNAHGITRFEYVFQSVNGSAKDKDLFPSKQYINVNGTVTETQTFNHYRRDGDTFRIWIRATDAMGNTKVDASDVHFDSSPPTLSRVSFVKNVNSSKFPFSSR